MSQSHYLELCWKAVQMTQARIGPSSKRKREDQTDNEQTPHVEKLRAAAAAYKVDSFDEWHETS